MSGQNAPSGLPRLSDAAFTDMKARLKQIYDCFNSVEKLRIHYDYGNKHLGRRGIATGDASTLIPHDVPCPADHISRAADLQAFFKICADVHNAGALAALEKRFEAVEIDARMGAALDRIRDLRRAWPGDAAGLWE